MNSSTLPQACISCSGWKGIWPISAPLHHKSSPTAHTSLLIDWASIMHSHIPHQNSCLLAHHMLNVTHSKLRPYTYVQVMGQPTKWGKTTNTYATHSRIADLLAAFEIMKCCKTSKKVVMHAKNYTQTFKFPK